MFLSKKSTRAVLVIVVVLSVLGFAGCGTDTRQVTPAAPAAFLSTRSLGFASATVGTAATGSIVTLTNSGGVQLLLSGFVLSDTKDFQTTSTCGSTLAAGESCTFTVQFTPQSAVALTGTLTITDNDGGVSGQQQVIALSGTGTPVPVSKSVVTPSSLSFGQIVLHTPTAAQMITVSNTGTAPLALGGYALSDTADFTIGSSTCGSSLQPAAQCTIATSFVPQMLGPVSAVLTLTTDSGGVPGTQQSVMLSGTGLPVPLPQLALAPLSLSFAPTVLKTSAPQQLISLTNTGTAPLVLSSIAVDEAVEFPLANACPNSLAAGASCTLSVGFTPQTTGKLNATLTLTDNSGLASGSVQQQIALTGTGLPAPAPQAVLSPSSGAFGNAYVGSVSPAQIFTVSNSGTAALTIESATLSDVKDFALTSNCGTTLAAGSSCSLSVVFQPQSAAALGATLTVTDNGGGQAHVQQSLALTGTGLTLPAPVAQLTPAQLTFPDTMQSLSAATQAITLTNTGNAGLVISGVALSDTQNFTLASNCPATLAPMMSCTMALGFQPASVAALQATLTVSDNSGSTGTVATGLVQQTVLLKGNGIAFEEPRAVVAPASLSFPRTVAGTRSASQTVTLSNAGTQPLHVASVALSASSSAAFTIASGTCTGSLAAGASCTESLVYSPTMGNTQDPGSLIFTDDALGKTGSTQTVPLTGSSAEVIAAVENFGDSITCGFYAQPNDGTGLVWSLEGYAGLFDTYLGVPAQNWCRQGDTAADLSRRWVPFHSTPASTGRQMFSLMIGTNDAYRYGIPQIALQTYTAEVAAAVSWLAIPNSDKVLGNSVTQQTGTWVQDVDFGVKSSEAGASLTFSVNEPVQGRHLYLVYHVWAQPYGQAGKASIAVDGTVQATVDESQSSGVYIPTENGTYDTFLVQAVPLGSVGTHTVTFSSVGPAGSTVGLLWAGVAQQDYRTVDGAPEVLVGYVPNSPSGNQTFAADNYSLQLQSLLPLLATDGMNIRPVDTSRVMDPGSDFADILHPNNAGHAKLAAAFEQAR